MRDAICPAARSLDEIGDWWTLLIVREAFQGARRFNEFQKGLGVAKNILAGRLRLLVESGIMESRAPANGSSRNEYHLTEKGRRLRLVLVALSQWGEDNLFDPDEERAIPIERATGLPVGRLTLTSADGRVLSPEEIAMVKRGTTRGGQAAEGE